jgi:acyl-CoA thioester hydrolase
MRTYRLERRVSHADVDFLGELKVGALLGLFEQAAVEASAEAGFDPAWYTREGRIWIIRRTRLERPIPVGGTDTLAVETSVADYRRARSLRRYEVQRCRPAGGAAGDPGSPSPDEVVARGTTDWVYCDVASGRPVSVPDTVRRAFSGDGLGESLPRAPALPDAGEGSPVDFILTVLPSHLDHVAHVNNAVYASFLEDGAFKLFAERGFSLERMLAAGGALRIRRFDAEYLSDALAGEVLTVRSWLDEASGPLSGAASGRPGPQRLVQRAERPGGSCVLRAISDWAWTWRPDVLGGVPRRDVPLSGSEPPGS